MENQNHEQLIQKLLNCALACENCAAQGFAEGQHGMMEKCIPLDIDCADICTLAARLLKRNSVIAHEFLLICESACRKCAEECSKHDHEHCKLCAKACLECADACHEHHSRLSVS